jgi:hypothetical protein
MPATTNRASSHKKNKGEGGFLCTEETWTQKKNESVDHTLFLLTCRFFTLIDLHVPIPLFSLSLPLYGAPLSTINVAR